MAVDNAIVRINVGAELNQRVKDLRDSAEGQRARAVEHRAQADAADELALSCDGWADEYESYVKAKRAVK